MKPLFFSVSNDVVDQITDLYDFVWPTISAMWNLRWQVKGFVNEVGIDKINDTQLLGRFDWGSGIHGVNIRKACLEKTWEDQQEQFARFLLINLFSIHESWIKSLQIKLGFSENIAKQLQFPTSIDQKGEIKGISGAINSIIFNSSPLIQNAFHPTLVNHTKYSFTQLENLMICYRYFKECRNSLAHQGGLADINAENWHKKFSALSSASSLNTQEIPFSYSTLAGKPIKLSLRGVVGFGDIIIKIVATLDAELSSCKLSEGELIDRFRIWSIAKGKGVLTLKRDPIARSIKITKLLKNLGFPEPVRTDEIVTLLINNRLLQ